MEQSILKSTKKILGVGPDDDTFDLDIITHINNAFSHLNDLGVGPPLGFVIEDETAVWEEFLDDRVMLSKAKTFVYLRTRQLFDPPTTSYLINALESQLREIEWRINVNREETQWSGATPVEVLDGGTPEDPNGPNPNPPSPHFVDG